MRWPERSLSERFWDKIVIGEPDACWPWTASCDTRGYGQFTVSASQRAIKSPRVAFYLTHGRWPTPCCLHTCDNPLCCNPAHLKEGTQRENVADMIDKGRARWVAGSQHPKAKLTERDIQIVRLLCGRIGCTQAEVGRRYGMSRGMMSEIVNGKRWRHVEDIRL
jgi:hypothetical protein